MTNKLNRKTREAVLLTARRCRSMDPSHYDDLGPQAVAFVEWCAANGRTFGHANIEEVVAEWAESAPAA